jgi:hypothetical protein
VIELVAACMDLQSDSQTDDVLTEAESGK